jgi:hypothetical protein
MPSNRNQLNDRLTRRFQDDESKQLIQDWRKTRNTRTPNQPSATTSYEGLSTQSLIGDGGGGGFYPSPTPAPTTIGDRGDLTPYPAPIQQPPPPHPGRPRYTRMPYQGRRQDHRGPWGGGGRPPWAGGFRPGQRPPTLLPSPYPSYPQPTPNPYPIRDPYQPIADPYTRRY